MGHDFDYSCIWKGCRLNKIPFMIGIDRHNPSTDLDERLEADGEYQANPSLPRLCYLLSKLIHHWEKLEIQSRRMSGFTSSQSSADKGKLSKSDKGRVQIKDPPTSRCQS